MSELRVIYQIKCLKNNKVYIGQTKNKNDRYKQHLYLLKNNKHSNRYLQKDFNLYGIASFKYIILEEVEENAIERETYWINYYGGIESDNTYNMLDNETENLEMRSLISNTLSGRIPWNKGIPCTEERKLKLINSYKGLSEDKKLEVSLKLKEIMKTKHPWKNKHHTEASKLKMSKAKKGRYCGKDNPNYGNIKYNKQFIQLLYEEFLIYKNYSYVGRLHNITGDSVRYYINRYIRGD